MDGVFYEVSPEKVTDLLFDYLYLLESVFGF